MANVQIIKEWSEAAPCLTSLRDTIDRDFRPMTVVNEKQKGAPFSVCREVMSYVDHLGQLYTGSTGVSQRFKAYMEQVLGEVYAPYKRRAGEVYQMYRCGTVHEFEPRVLKNKKGELLVWLCYRGGRTSFQLDLADIGKMTVTHLEPVAHPAIKRGFALPVSTNCLLDDLEASIDRLITAGPENERVSAWNRAARELNSYAKFEFSI